MPRFNLRLPFCISVSLKRCTPPHPVRLAAVLVFFTLVWQAVLLGLEALFGVHIGDTPFSELVLIAVIAGVCAAICRETWSAYLAFLTSGFLSSQLAPWAGLLPVAVVALHRLTWRYEVAVHRWRRMRTVPSLSTRDKVRLCLHDVQPQLSFWRIARELRERNNGRRRRSS
jgi:hypothetical protein